MSIELSEKDIAEIGLLLSAERLAALTQLTGSAREAIALHQQTLYVGASLITVVAVVEIALRNSICARLSAHFKAAGWLLRPPAPFNWRPNEKAKITLALATARRAEYAKKSQAEKHALDALAYPAGRLPATSHAARAKARQSKIVVTDGKIIAELTLFFWKRLFSGEYEQTLWRTTLKRVFPNKSVRRADVASHLEQIYQTRNRLAHHEPIYGKRLAETQLALTFVLENLGANAPSSETPLAKLLANDINNIAEQARALGERYAAFQNP